MKSRSDLIKLTAMETSPAASARPPPLFAPDLASGLCSLYSKHHTCRTVNIISTVHRRCTVNLIPHEEKKSRRSPRARQVTAQRWARASEDWKFLPSLQNFRSRVKCARIRGVANAFHFRSALDRGASRARPPTRNVHGQKADGFNAARSRRRLSALRARSRLADYQTVNLRPVSRDQTSRGCTSERAGSGMNRRGITGRPALFCAAGGRHPNPTLGWRAARQLQVVFPRLVTRIC